MFRLLSASPGLPDQRNFQHETSQTSFHTSIHSLKMALILSHSCLHYIFIKIKRHNRLNFLPSLLLELINKNMLILTDLIKCLQDDSCHNIIKSDLFELELNFNTSNEKNRIKFFCYSRLCIINL